MDEEQESVLMQVDDGDDHSDAAHDGVPTTAIIADVDMGVRDLIVDDADSAVGMSPRSTTSASSTVYDFVEKNNHTYHRYKEGKYVLPNDEGEQKRLDTQHDLFLHTFNYELHLAPLKGRIRNALDIGTGTGIWATQFAQLYPSANVIGIDLSPIQPLYVPRNCQFEISDVEDDWMYTETFEYIHGRMLYPWSGNFESVVQKCYANLTPGGYFELQDSLLIACIDESWNGKAIQRWANLLLEGAKKLGIDWEKVEKYPQWISAAGFKDIKEVEGVWPTNSWPKSGFQKHLGRSANEILKQGLHGMSVEIFTAAHGWTEEEVDSLLEDVKENLDDRNIHCYVPIRVVYGRKPEQK